MLSFMFWCALRLRLCLMLVCLWRLQLWLRFFWPHPNRLRTADFPLPLMLRRVGYSLSLRLSLAL